MVNYSQAEYDALDAKRATLEAELAELEELLALQHRRTAKADALWQQATGRPHVLPDLGTLIEFLLDRAARAEDAAIQLAKQNSRLTSTLRSLILTLDRSLQGYGILEKPIQEARAVLDSLTEAQDV